MKSPYDAILVMSFGGPEGMEDVRPFLDNVLEGKRVPPSRKEEVVHHYEAFGGVSPINEQNRALIRELEKLLEAQGPDLPVYFGNRNWHPFITETMAEMTRKGHQRVLAFFTSAYSSYSGCRQYREDIQAAREAAGPDAPQVDKLRVYHNHPGFIEANCDHIAEALATLGGDATTTHVLFTAHSIPDSMAACCKYEEQLTDACSIVAERMGLTNWRLVYQSRSGPPHQPWLEPDVCDAIRELHDHGVDRVVLSPIGFISDHLEVLFDLDTEARECCEEVGIKMARAKTAGTHPSFIAMIHDLIVERMEERPEKPALGKHGPWHDVCPENCCRPRRAD